MSESSKGQRRSPRTEFKKGHKIPRGPITDETKRKISETLKRKGILPPLTLGIEPWNKGKTMSEEHRKVLSEAHKGQIPWNKGKPFLKVRGENHWKWRGGISDKGYGEDWTNKLRDSIRARDNYLCQECGLTQDNLEYLLDVHHIDEDKKNNIPENLITLCRSCHVHIHSDLLLAEQTSQQGTIII